MVDRMERANQFASEVWDEVNSYRRKAGAPEIAVDPELREAVARRLIVWNETAAKYQQQAEEATKKLDFLKSKGLTVGVAYEANKEPYLAYVIDSGSELCDLDTVNKLVDAEIKAEETPKLLAVCKAALDYLETGKNPAAGCVAAPTADVAIVQMLRETISLHEALAKRPKPDLLCQLATAEARYIEMLDKVGSNQSICARLVDRKETYFVANIFTKEQFEARKAFFAGPTKPGEQSPDQWMNEARQIAAQCWTDEATSSVVMIPELAEAFAQRLAAWMSMAAQYHQNADYWWRGILQEVFAELPDEMKRQACLCDDGTIAADPHLSKLPGIIKQLSALAYVWIPGNLTEQGAQGVLNEVVKKLNRAGFGFFADGTVYGNGVFVDRLRARALLERTDIDSEGIIPSQTTNPEGLHGRYWIRKADGTPCDPEAVYFVLRLDNKGSDPAHLKAGRFAARMYSLYLQTIKANHLQKLAEELVALCNGFDYDEQVDFPGFNIAELRDMFVNPYAYDIAFDYNSSEEAQADAFGAEDSAKWHKDRGAFLKARAAELEAKFSESIGENAQLHNDNE